MPGKCKVCGLYDDYAEPNSAGDYYCYIHFIDVGYKCLCCGSNSNVVLVSSRTAYYWDGIGEDPNADIPLCKYCSVEHDEYWNDMWNQYYFNLL
jgi:hypothetical protein